MSDIEVEAVDAVDATLTGEPAEYVLYGGKGGVGKTTMAAATGVASATEGTDTLVVSTDPAHSLSDTFEAGVGADPTRVREDVGLYAVEIDPDEALAEADAFGADGSLDVGGLDALLGGADGPLGGGMPGADEAAAVQQLLRFLDDDRFDRVVVDTAPTGHTLRLLELPEVMDSMLGRFLQFRQRFSGMMDGVKGAMGADVDPEEGMADLEATRERIERLRDVLTDPARTDFRVVTVPEEMSVLEADRLVDRLDGFGVPVGTVVVNRVLEPFSSVTDTDADAFVSPDLEDCAFCQRRWEVQRGALREAQELFRGHDVRRVPLFADEVRGREMLRVVAACL